MMLLVRIIDVVVGAVLALSAPDGRARRLAVAMVAMTVLLLGILGFTFWQVWVGAT
ncbi:MAG: hypothetical protein SW019_03920 [Actinomycetota bacterium]|nr:hypothetical protein [Actinomycetota bacterium]